MGRALITGGGTDGRYAIQVDYGSAQRDALIAALNQLIEKYNTAIDGQAAEMVTLQAREAEAKEQIRIASNGITPPGYVDEGAPLADDLKRAIITIGRENLLRIQMALRPLQLNGDKMKFERAAALAKIATLTTAQATVNKDAWCCTYTEDGAGQVATIDINGESSLTLIAPEARAWAPADGVMTMPHVMSPAQSFFNTAILPGWQKHRPTYRWGTISGLNKQENTASVDLAPATSSAQGLNINRFDSLSDIPVQYLTCNAQAFELGDRVVVQFAPGVLPGDLDAKVIGFLDNPKPCGWPVYMADIDVVYRTPSVINVFFKSSVAAFDRLYQASLSDTLNVYWLIDGTRQLQPMFRANLPGQTHTYGYQVARTTTVPGDDFHVSLHVPTAQTFPHWPPLPFIIMRGYREVPGVFVPGQLTETVACTCELVMRIGAQVVFNAAVQFPSGIGPIANVAVKSSGGFISNWPPPGYPSQTVDAIRLPVLPLDYTLNPNFPTP
jgi:hypothetical protein